jgi:hypothetical protein
MPDFDTQTPQEPNEPNKLRTHWNATKGRIALIATRVRNLVIANRLRTPLIRGALLLLALALPIGLLIYSYSKGQPAPVRTPVGTVTCDRSYLVGARSCIAPRTKGDSVLCKAWSRAQVEDEVSCWLHKYYDSSAIEEINDASP